MGCLRRTCTAIVFSLVLIAPTPAAADYAHVVAPGETLTSVAAQDGLSVAALAAANGLSTESELIAGTVLQIPPQGAAVTPAVAPATTTTATTATTATTTAPSSAAPATTAGTSSYVVRPGDTLSAIAARAGTTVAALASLNGLDPDRFLLAGTTLVLPGGSAASPQPAAQVQPAVGPPYPVEAFATSAQIAQIASAAGVPPALAEAIAWQESGFNDAEVSVDGAVGVMQILPSTWAWITSSLPGGELLDPSTVAGDVTAGVLMLRSLLDATGSQALTVAAYYQGLGSVQQVGVEPATSQYVADVLALEQSFGGI